MNMETVARAFVERATTQGLKGKARDRAALEFVLGASVMAPEENKQSFLFSATISMRGYSYLEEVLKS